MFYYRNEFVPNTLGKFLQLRYVQCIANELSRKMTLE